MLENININTEHLFKTSFQYRISNLSGLESFTFDFNTKTMLKTVSFNPLMSKKSSNQKHTEISDLTLLNSIKLFFVTLPKLSTLILCYPMQ